VLLYLLFDNSILSKSLIEHPVISFSYFAVCDINHFGVCVSLFMFCIFVDEGGQYFCYNLKYPCNAWIIQYARPKIVASLLMLNFMMG